MANKTKDEIIETREKVRNDLEQAGFEVVNTLFTDGRYSSEYMEKEDIINIPLYFFANSILKMSKCNVVYFCKGWEEARGCRLEHAIAESYEIKIIEED